MNNLDSLHRKAGIAACLFAGSAVLAGAFAAHALRGRLGTEAMMIWHTAVNYQFWHALALLGIACLSGNRVRALRWAVGAFVIGTVVFSGSLYALALGAPRIVGLLTPIGGLSFVVGWSCLLAAFWHSDSR